MAQGAYNVLAGGTYRPKKECRIKEQADHNLMYLLSVALLDGEIWPEQFTEERINRRDVQDLMKKVDRRGFHRHASRASAELQYIIPGIVTAAFAQA